jgi:hypothetical protein
MSITKQIRKKLIETKEQKERGKRRGKENAHYEKQRTKTHQ